MMKANKIILILLVLILLIGGMILLMKKDNTKNSKPKEYDKVGEYNVDLIRAFNSFSENKNYLISPYNIEVALNMLRDGADGKTKEELDKVLGNRVINDVSVKDKVGIANAVFIKNIYQNSVKTDYYNTLNTKYNSEVIYDEFESPDKINNWVKEKTNGMIDKILNKMDKDFVMGLATALAIDVKWQSEFDCISTLEEEFTKETNEKMKVEMMHKSYDTPNYKYLENSDMKGIVIPYQKEENSNVELEFVGILPKNGIANYINNLTKEKLDNITKNGKVAGDDLHINLSLPRFTYDYNADKFIDILRSMGIKEAFNEKEANFTKMIEIDENVYVGEAIHKTHINLNEKGTKAAAVTYFGMFKESSMPFEKYEEIDIKFNKPFIYLIREKNTGEILFFGTVYEPNKWSGSTCNNM